MAVAPSEDDQGAPKTIPWSEFARLEPELARFGAERLIAAPAYLATIRRSGLPRVHPVTPILSPRGLFLFMEPTSPKARDLEERAWFALHNGVPDNAGSGGEFNVSGQGFGRADPGLWAHVAEAAGYTPLDRYILFELQVSEARCHGYGDVPIPSSRSWKVGK
ncbi:MAG TPA: pyridoxamine 5'-phosphate oxidase [Acidimicrobiia bacterium]|jgi:hypothetical protein